MTSLSGAASVNGSVFAGILASVTPSADVSGQADPLSQLAALIQNGTPLSTIVDQLSQSIGSALQQQLAGKLPQSELDRLKSSLTQSIANALAPPGNAPPGTPQQQAAALAQRLRGLIESLARDTTDSSGQQNDISGTVLDAKSAREHPAQAQGKGTASALDVSSLVRSLLSGAVSALSSTPVNPPNFIDRNGGSRVLRADPLHLDTAPNSDATLASATPPSLAPAADGSAITDASQSGTASGQPVITMATAPDVLARMLVRASGVDARINGASATASGANAQGAGTQTPSAISARLSALLASLGGNATSVASSNGSQAGSQTTYGFDQQSAFQSSGSTQDSSNPNAIGGPAFTFSSQVQNAVQSAAATAQPVDTTAVIEQLVKGMSMRTNDQGSSEIRLHLQPENLGDVTMKITVTGSQISANVVASSADVRNALMSNHHQLARSLADAGLTLSGFSVDVSGGDTGRQGQNQDRTAGFGRRYTVHELHGAPSSETAALSSLAPPILSGPGLELFNYLA